ncbi:MAG: hypothetical protein ACREOO_24800 [bacterium]
MNSKTLVKPTTISIVLGAVALLIVLDRLNAYMEFYLPRITLVFVCVSLAMRYAAATSSLHSSLSTEVLMGLAISLLGLITTTGLDRGLQQVDTYTDSFFDTFNKVMREFLLAMSHGVAGGIGSFYVLRKKMKVVKHRLESSEFSVLKNCIVIANLISTALIMHSCSIWF